MLLQKQKNNISYDLYASKKSKQPDYLCRIINKYKYMDKVQSVQLDPKQEELVKQRLKEKRIQQIKKSHKYIKVSNPEPYIKRTWVSPFEASFKKQQLIYCAWKKSPQNKQSDTQNNRLMKKVCNILDINKKMHLFGEFMFCEFQGKQNGRMEKFRIKQKKMDVMYKQYANLMNSTKKSIVILNKDSRLQCKNFINPLKDDQYFQKIIRHKDEELCRLLINSLSVSGNFTFSSYIQFYQIFVWQQSPKQIQIEFVLKILMGIISQIPYKSLSQKIDLMCKKINLKQQNQSLSDFNEVMKKLIFGAQYEKCQSYQQKMSRRTLTQSLQVNQQCISIFINVFFSQ